MYNGPSIDHGLLSPSGRMSKRSREAALKRERERLFGDLPPGSWKGEAKPMTAIEKAAHLRRLAAMAGKSQSKKLIAQAEELEAQQ